MFAEAEAASRRMAERAERRKMVKAQVRAAMFLQNAVRRWKAKRAMYAMLRQQRRREEVVQHMVTGQYNGVWVQKGVGRELVITWSCECGRCAAQGVAGAR